MVGTFTRIVGRKASIFSKRVSVTHRSGKRAVVAPTENGKSRLLPVAYPKKSLGTDKVMSSGPMPNTPLPYNSVVFANERCDCTTALGSPVVPPLKSQMAASSRWVGKGSNSVEAASSARVKSAPPTSWSTGDAPAPSFAWVKAPKTSAPTKAAVAPVYS